MNDTHSNDKTSIDTKARLIDAATELFAKQGYDGTSTREIAAQADCNISLINHYFGGKQGLLQAIVSGCFDVEEQELRALLASGPTASGLVARFIDFFFDLFYQHTYVMRIIQREIANMENPTADYARDRISANLEMIAELIQRDQGLRPSEVSPRALANMIVGMVSFCLLDKNELNSRASVRGAKDFIKSCFLIVK
ncbi:TetR family transcriptional regulator [bacterium]|nr:TetR family transcriptional regulator [bacterium]